MKLFISLVSFNSEKTLAPCIESLLASKDVNISLFFFDNASTDNSFTELTKFKDSAVVRRSPVNLGFCGGQNEGVTEFLKSDCDAICFLNPDIHLLPETLSLLTKALFLNNDISAVTPKLLRCDENLVPQAPPIIDAAGMILERSLRHFDRGSGALDHGQFEMQEDVFGGTGALFIIKKEAVKKLILPRIDDRFIEKIHPGTTSQDRAQLFDEAFFAYREDADLCYRMKNLSLKIQYVPQAIAYHQRRVTPERRKDLPDLLNYYSVRNRFLLQINNFSLKKDGIIKFIYGIVIRNIMVVAGVIFTEQSSLRAFRDLIILFPRSIKIRNYLHDLTK